MYRLEDWMSAIYQRWLTSQNLPQMSADELLFMTLTDYQRAYVSRFVNLWWKNERRQR